jgi:hypothetical protein
MKRNEALVDLVMFAATLTVAYRQEWTAKDIVWCLWISSLLLGYSFIVAGALSIYVHGNLPGGTKSGRARSLAAAGEKAHVQPLLMNIPVIFVCFMFLGIRSGLAWAIILVSIAFTALGHILSGRDDGTAAGRPGLQIMLGRFFSFSPAVLFTLGFFTVHFGGFHFVHSLFLNGFFPLVEWNPFGRSPVGVLDGFFMIVARAITDYWPFVLFGAVTQAGNLRQAFQAKEGPNMFRPYLNVVRMHILIFVFAGLQAAGLQNLALYPVLVFYFFPIGSILKAFAARRGKSRLPA